eukprot:5220281-Pyramimonas_sp.AAC.1
MHRACVAIDCEGVESSEPCAQRGALARKPSQTHARNGRHAKCAPREASGRSAKRAQNADRQTRCSDAVMHDVMAIN